MTNEQETRKRAKYTRGRLRDIVAYFYDRPNTDITITQLEKVFKHYGRDAIMTTMNYIIVGRKDRPDIEKLPIVKVTHGVWRLNVKMRDAETVYVPPKQDTSVSWPGQTKEKVVMPPPFDTLTVTVIKEVDNEMVVVDDNTNIYRMVRIV
jgi:hypothetical protein